MGDISVHTGHIRQTRVQELIHIQAVTIVVYEGVLGSGIAGFVRVYIRACSGISCSVRQQGTRLSLEPVASIVPSSCEKHNAVTDSDETLSPSSGSVTWHNSRVIEAGLRKQARFIYAALHHVV